MSDAIYRITFTPGQMKAQDLDILEVTDEEVTQLASTTFFGQKDGLAVIPAVFRPCPEHCLGSGKDCGGGVFHRLGENVEAMTMLGGDFDHLSSKAQFLTLVDRIRAFGLKLWWWETFNSTAAAFRARLLIPFDEPISIASPNQWKRIAWPTLFEALGLLVPGLAADDRCTDPGRVFFTPRAPKGASPREWGFHDGVALDWRKALGPKLEAFERAARGNPRVTFITGSQTSAPVSDEQLDEARAALKRYGAKVNNAELRAAIGNVVAGKRPGTLPSERPTSMSPREPLWKDVLWALSKVAPDWIATEALLEIVRPAWDDEARAAGAAGDDVTEWSKLEDLLERARPKTAAKKAQEAAERAAFVGRWSESPSAQREREQFQRALARSRGAR